MNKKKEQLLVLTGFRCNNNCVMCSVMTKKGLGDKSGDDIFKILKKGIENGYSDVEFTGGEPTIRPDIINIVSYAKRCGYKKIALSTNGRLFSYKKFCDRIIEAGLNKVTFSLLGSNSLIHNAITRTPNSFGEVVRGIKKVQQFPNVHINISSVISRLNYTDLIKFGKFVLSLGIKQWYLLDLIPDGNAQKAYGNIAVRLKKISKELNSLIEISDNFKELGFFDFPFCLFKEGMRKKENTMFVNAKMRAETASQVGYHSKRIFIDKEGSYGDIHRTNIEVCGKCRYNNECGGLWNEYIDAYSDDELIKLARANKCV